MCSFVNSEYGGLWNDLPALECRWAAMAAAYGRSRIFLTGGTGFFGKWLLHSFLVMQRNASCSGTITVLSRAPEEFLKKNPCFADCGGLNFIEGDIRTFDFSSLPTFDYVIHGATAASARLEREHPDEMFSVIADGTRHLLDFVRRRGVRRLLFISSGAVYGPQPPAVSFLPETFEGEPSTAYGKGKKLSEQFCLEEASNDGFECVIARPFAFVGPYLPLDIHFAIGNFIRDCLKNCDLVIQGDGTPLRSYLYAADLAEWLWTILLRGRHGRAYNVGSDEAISILDLAELVRACAGTRNEIIIRTKKAAGLPPARYIPSIERARVELGLTVQYNLSDAITRTLMWHRRLGRKEEDE